MTVGWLNTVSILQFLLILSRMSGMLVSAPILSHPSIPALSKIGLAVTVSLIFFPLVVNGSPLPLPHDLFQLSLLLGQEVIIGLILGFLLNLVMMGAQMAGDLIATQSGMAISSALDPISQTNIPTLAQFYFYLALLLFLSLNLHHYAILGVYRSYQLLPLGVWITRPELLFERLMHMGSLMFTLAIMTGLPVLGVLLVGEIILAIVAKTMPQMNIFVVGLPFKVVLALFIALMTLPVTVDYLHAQLAEVLEQFLTVTKGLSH